MYEITTLPNKLKVITAPVKGAHGVTQAIYVRAGSRYETDKVAGLSHFVEHMVFKGTKNRPKTSDISRAIEGVGGHLNAATGQDHTFYFNQVPARHADDSFDVLADMLQNSLFRPEDVELESGVIVEELNMYRDVPMRYIDDLLMTLMWPDNTLGRDIIGTKKSITSVRRPDFTKYLHDMYQPQNMTIVAAGKVNHKEIVDRVKKYFGQEKNKTIKKFTPAKSRQISPRVLVYPKPTDQVHLALALPGLPHEHKDMPALALLDIILGTGMSSRLFTRIREERGLCYSVHSFVERFEDVGVFGVAAGLNTGKIEEAIIAIKAELKLLTTEKVSATELKEAKEYLRGSTLLSMDNTDNLANWYGMQGLFYKSIDTPEEKIKRLLQVTENDILKVAKKLLDFGKLNLAIIGPFEKKDQNKFLKLLKN